MAGAVSGTPAFNLPVFTLLPAALLTTGLLACLIPALRATRIDPTTALRD
jgi:ABC-type lipoprotein release transport system permease subunit